MWIYGPGLRQIHRNHLQNSYYVCVLLLVLLCLHVLTSIWILSPGWSSAQRSSSVVGWAAPAWRTCGAPHRPSTGFYRPDSSPCWNPAVLLGSHSFQKEKTTLPEPFINTNVLHVTRSVYCNCNTRKDALRELLFKRFQKGF